MFLIPQVNINTMYHLSMCKKYIKLTVFMHLLLIDGKEADQHLQSPSWPFPRCSSSGVNVIKLFSFVADDEAK